MERATEQNLRVAWVLMVISTVLSAILLCLGSFHLWQYFRNPKPLEISLSDYVTNRPSADWLVIKNCEVDYTESVSFRAGEKAALYAPVRSINDGMSPPAIVLKVEDPSVLDLFASLSTLRGEELNKAVQNNREKLLVTGPIQGLRIRKLVFDEPTSSSWTKSPWQPAANYVLIDQDASPSLNRALIQAGSGIGLLLYARYLWGAIRRLRQKLKLPALAQ